MSTDTGITKTAVLNIDTQNIVWLPISENIIASKNIIVHGLSINMPIIRDKDYKGLMTESWMTEPEKNDTENYFFHRCIDYASKTDAYFLSDSGYGRVYKYLKDCNFTIKNIIEHIPKIIELFVEGECGSEPNGESIATYMVEGELTELYLLGFIKNNPVQIVGAQQPNRSSSQ